MELDGGATSVLAGTAGAPGGIAIVDGTVYFGENGNLGAVSARGGKVVLFGAPSKMASAIASDGQFLYWTDRGSTDATGARQADGCVWRCALATCASAPPTALVCGLYGPNAIAVDAPTVYWTTLGPGSSNELAQGTASKMTKP